MMGKRLQGQLYGTVCICLNAFTYLRVIIEILSTITILSGSIKHRRTYFPKINSHFGLNGSFMVYGV